MLASAVSGIGGMHDGDARHAQRSPRSPMPSVASPRVDASVGSQAQSAAAAPQASAVAPAATWPQHSKLSEQAIGGTDVPNTIKLLSELERSWSMFTANWRVVDLFAGMQIWQEHTGETTSSLEQLNGIFLSTVTAGVIAFLAATIGGGGVAIAVILSGLVVCGATLTLSAVRAKGDVPSYKVIKTIDGSPLDVFLHIMNSKNYPIWDASIDKADVIHTIDDHSDIIHIVYRPVWIWPIWLKPRDLCLLRYWRRTEDGSYMICLQSTVHPECPPTHQVVRARCNGGGFIIAPRSQSSTHREETSSLVTHVVHMDPLGWESRMLRRFAITYSYIRPQILAVSGLQEVMEARKYVCPNIAEEFAVAAASAEEMNAAHRRSLKQSDAGPDGALSRVAQLQEFQTNVPREMWTEPDPGMMLVRGPDYLTDRRKVPSAPPAFRLMGTDLYRSDHCVYHVSSHPGCTVQKELKRHEAEGTEMPFTFVMNFVVPGGLNLVLYYQPPDPSVLNDGSPFAELMHDFLDGTDEFRSEHFKLIPCIFEGSFIVRQAVGTTPVIIGKKLSQPYFRGKNYFELDVDIGSSAVANRVVGLVLGYTKKIVVDMGFLIEGQRPEELPERLFGSVRLVHIDLGVTKKLE